MEERTLWPVAEKYLTVDLLAENLPGAFLIYRATEGEEILFASRELAHIFECDSLQDLLRFTGGSFSTLVYPEDIEKVTQTVREQVKASGGFDYVKYRVITKSGKIKHIEDWGRLVHSQLLGEDVFYVWLNDLQTRDNLIAMGGETLNEPEKPSAPSAPSGGTDSLTGLLNLRAFRERAPELIEKILGMGKNACCAYFNIRNFHTYNEAYGFSGGDRMLRSVARILQDTFPYGLAARLSDDHFAIIAPQEGLKEKIERMGGRVNHLRRDVIVEIKAGVYIIQDGGADISLICDRARQACESIKGEYGAAIQIYDEKTDRKARLQEHILTSLQAALDGGHIRVLYQPVVDVATGKTASMEALARWEDPEWGTLSPGEFLGILEEQHLIHKLDGHVIHTVCRDLRARMDAHERGEGPEAVPVSVNLSRLDFELTDIVGVIEDAAGEFNIPKGLLSFEISESFIAMDMSALKNELDRLRKHGFHVWMDAFGSGYSSLKVLKDFNMDGLKIDMDMVQSLDTERANVIISTVIEMARKLGIPALSKGVETPAQLEFLKGAGCSLAQGYLVGRPEPAEKLNGKR